MARVERTRYFYEYKEEFIDKLKRELYLFIKRAEKRGWRPACRLNATSDIPWEKVAPSIFEEFEEIRFYDYTKNFRRMLRYLKRELPGNYHLTFSRSESNWDECQVIRHAGGNVAVVFWPKVPRYWGEYAVNDGDRHDLTFLHPDACIIGLRAKGYAIDDHTGFVVRKEK